MIALGLTSQEVYKKSNYFSVQPRTVVENVNPGFTTLSDFYSKSFGWVGDKIE